MEKYKDKLNEISSSYTSIHEEINNIESKLKEYNMKYEMISKKLNELRDSEREIINNIERETGKKVTPDDLLKIINS